MDRTCAYLFCGGLALATVALLVALQAPTVTASPASLQDPKISDATISANRALKGDRLPTLLPAHRGIPADLQGLQAPSPNQKLPVGCEAVVSAMTRSSLARTPGRCVS